MLNFKFQVFKIYILKDLNNLYGMKNSFLIILIMLYKEFKVIACICHRLDSKFIRQSSDYTQDLYWVFSHYISKPTCRKSRRKDFFC